MKVNFIQFCAECFSIIFYLKSDSWNYWGFYFLGLVVKEGGHKKITTRQLSATDESGRIHYDVTIPPKLGRLEFTDEPGTKVT